MTGANKGIGLQIAKELAAHDFTVLVGSRDARRGEAAAQSVSKNARALQLDLTDHGSVAAAAERIRDEAMLPLLREAPAARIVNVSSVVGSLTKQTDPAAQYRSIHSVTYVHSVGVGAGRLETVVAGGPLARRAPEQPCLSGSSATLPSCESSRRALAVYAELHGFNTNGDDQLYPARHAASLEFEARLEKGGSSNMLLSQDSECLQPLSTRGRVRIEAGQTRSDVVYLCLPLNAVGYRVSSRLDSEEHLFDEVREEVAAAPVRVVARSAASRAGDAGMSNELEFEVHDCRGQRMDDVTVRWSSDSAGGEATANETGIARAGDIDPSTTQVNVQIVDQDTEPPTSPSMETPSIVPTIGTDSATAPQVDEESGSEASELAEGASNPPSEALNEPGTRPPSVLQSADVLRYNLELAGEKKEAAVAILQAKRTEAKLRAAELAVAQEEAVRTTRPLHGIALCQQ